MLPAAPLGGCRDVRKESNARRRWLFIVSLPCVFAKVCREDKYFIDYISDSITHVYSIFSIFTLSLSHYYPSVPEGPLPTLVPL